MYYWDFGDGTIVPYYGESSITHTFIQSGLTELTNDFEPPIYSQDIVAQYPESLSMPDNYTCTEPEVTSIKFWDYISTFWDKLDSKSKDMFENFWLGMYLVGKSLIKQATRVKEVIAPEDARTCIVDDYYELKVGPFYSKPLDLDPTLPQPNYNIYPIAKRPSDSENSLAENLIDLSANDYYKIRDIAERLYVIVQVKDSDNRCFRISEGIINDDDQTVYPFILSSREPDHITVTIGGDPVSIINPRYIPPIKTDPPNVITHSFAIKLESADLRYIGDKTFTIYLTTGKAYDVDKRIMELPVLCNYISGNGPQLMRDVDYTLYNNIVEFKEDLFDIKYANPGDSLYCRVTQFIEENLFTMYGSLVGIPDWTKYNYRPRSGKTAINGLLKSIQNSSDILYSQTALGTYYSLPLAPDKSVVQGLYESYNYRVASITNQNITVELPEGVALSKFVYDGAVMNCNGMDYRIDTIVDRDMGSIDFTTDISNLVVGDSLNLRLINRFKIKTVDGHIGNSSPYITVTDTEGFMYGEDAIQHMVDIVKSQTTIIDAESKLETYQLPELTIYGMENLADNYNGVYHISSVGTTSSGLNLFLYSPDLETEEPKYNDFLNAEYDPDVNQGFVHIPWPTHKFLLLLLDNGEYYKAYLDAPTDTILEKGDVLNKYDNLSRSASVLNNMVFGNWNEFNQFRRYTGLDLHSGTLYLTGEIPYAKYGEYFPSDYVSTI